MFRIICIIELNCLKWFLKNVHGMEGVTATESNCRIVAELLKVPLEGLKRVLTTRITVSHQ